MDKNSKILITGGQGWIGKKLGAYLSQEGFQEVYALAGSRSGLDLGDDSTIGWAFDINPDVVVHLATRPPTQENCLDFPAGMMYENLFVTSKIIEEAKKNYDINERDKNIVLGVSASGPTKRWDIENYIKLASKLSEYKNCKFFIFPFVNLDIGTVYSCCCAHLCKGARL